MTLSQIPDEGELRELFEQVELPPGLEARWQNKVVAPDKGRRAARRLRFGSWFQPANPWLRAAAAGTAAMIAIGTVAVVAANRPPSDDPDPDVIETITVAPPTSRDVPPSVSEPPTAGSSGPTSPGAETPSVVQEKRGQDGKPTVGQPPPNPPSPAPARGPLTDWPDSSNTGVPVGTNLRQHSGDLHVTKAGEIVADLRVDGVVYVEAPNVTLRRVHVAAPGGSMGGVFQHAPGLTIEDSEILSGANANAAVIQQHAGLTVRRSAAYGWKVGVQLTRGDSTIVDNNLVSTTGDFAVYVVGPVTGATIRHNALSGAIHLSGAVTELTAENNLLGTGSHVAFYGTPGPDSHHLRVLNNHFRRVGANPFPSSGWDGQAPGNTWTGNVWIGTSEPVNP